MSRRRWGGRRAQRLTALVLATHGTRCHLCGRPGATTADHLLPRSLGGSDDLANLRPAHHRCNSARGARALGLPPEDSSTWWTTPPTAPPT